MVIFKKVASMLHLLLHPSLFLSFFGWGYLNITFGYIWIVYIGFVVVIVPTIDERERTRINAGKIFAVRNFSTLFYKKHFECFCCM